MTDVFNLETTFQMFCGCEEVTVYIAGQVQAGADAATDSQGLPTETATAPDAFATFIRIKGKEYTDKQAADLFDLTVEEWDERCAAELLDTLEDLEAAEHLDDDLYF